jgi:hypothetical protein
MSKNVSHSSKMQGGAISGVRKEEEKPLGGKNYGNVIDTIAGYTKTEKAKLIKMISYNSNPIMSLKHDIHGVLAVGDSEVNDAQLTINRNLLSALFKIDSELMNMNGKLEDIYKRLDALENRGTVSQSKPQLPRAQSMTGGKKRTKKSSKKKTTKRYSKK